MVTSDTEKQKAFDEAIARFHAVASPDSEVAQRFLSAKGIIVQEIERSVRGKHKPGAPIMPVSVSKEFQDIFYPSGRHSAGPSILCYLDDAVRMYETRKDEHAGETALLFDPRSQHIKALRTLVDAYTRSDARFSPESREFAAATAVGKALDDVQNAHYLPKGKKKDGSSLEVHGFVSGDSIKTYGTGIVCRNYGVRQGIGEYQMLEIGSDGLLPHLAESNAIASSINHQITKRMDARNDISVICRNGDVRKFQYNSIGKDTGNKNTLRIAWDAGMEAEPSIHKVEEFKKSKRDSGSIGIKMCFSPEEVTVVEKELLPYLEQQLPALSAIPPKQRAR